MARTSLMQLNRDTTIQSLTVTPSLSAGVVVWEDSPLVRAVRDGSVLVVDEADKAPLEVVVVLKGMRCRDLTRGGQWWIGLQVSWKMASCYCLMGAHVVVR